MTRLETGHKIKWKQISWVNTVPEQLEDTGCYGGFNQPMTLLTTDYAPPEARKTFITVM